MIAVLGAGTWGTALAVVVARNNPKDKVLLWGRHRYKDCFPEIKLPDNIEFTNDLIATINQATYLLIVVPSHGFSDLIHKIKPYLDTTKHKIISATKGLDAATNKFLSLIVANLLTQKLPMAVLSGPSFAKEVVNNLPTAVVMAFQEQHQVSFNKFIKKLNAKTFRVYASHDLIGVQLGGVFKNVLAVATGMSDGLGFGANARAALITRGLAEVLPLAEKIGANSRTLMGLSGAGDMFLTCSDNQSRNRRLGMLLASGATIEQAKLQIGQAVEALDNIASLHKLAMDYSIEMPIVVAIWKILNKSMSIKQAVEDLLAREPQAEYM